MAEIILDRSSEKQPVQCVAAKLRRLARLSDMGLKKRFKNLTRVSSRQKLCNVWPQITNNHD